VTVANLGLCSSTASVVNEQKLREAIEELLVKQRHVSGFRTVDVSAFSRLRYVRNLYCTVALITARQAICSYNIFPIG
jgi:hypothetical protein